MLLFIEPIVNRILDALDYMGITDTMKLGLMTLAIFAYLYRRWRKRKLNPDFKWGKNDYVLLYIGINTLLGTILIGCNI